MPVRSLSSPVLKWPDAHSVRKALGDWAERIAASRPGIVRIGYFGSYARGDWGVGSDLDIVVVTTGLAESHISGREISRLPVPADLLSYTEIELEDMKQRGRFGGVLAEEVVWVFPRSHDRGSDPSLAQSDA
ncbi:MAG: nucleotidyltransferase domain-containing protein [Acidobacteria bacterium]|nr:nucleotidyltransferase domain-containing protein [Acidobacteriota bacterium]